MKETPEIDALVRAADDLLHVIDVWVDRGAILHGLTPPEQRIVDNLRAALDKVKS